jgi:hypothetical protein
MARCALGYENGCKTRGVIYSTSTGERFNAVLRADGGYVLHCGKEPDPTAKCAGEAYFGRWARSSTLYEVDPKALTLPSEVSSNEDAP